MKIVLKQEIKIKKEAAQNDGQLPIKYKLSYSLLKQ